MKIELTHKAETFHHSITRFGVVHKGKSKKKGTVIIDLQENYDTIQVNRLFWDSFLLLMNRLFETHRCSWNDVIIDKAGKNFRMLLENHKQRQ